MIIQRNKLITRKTMVDLASIFSDENEDFRNKAKVSATLAHISASLKKKSQSTALRRTSVSSRGQCTCLRKVTKSKSFR